MKTYKVTVFNKANKFHQAFYAYNTEGLLEELVEFASKYQKESLDVLAKLLNTNVDAIVEKLVNVDSFYANNVTEQKPENEPIVMIDFYQGDDDIESNGLMFTAANKKTNESFMFEASIEL